MLSDSAGYAAGAVWKKWPRWILLVVSSILFPFLLGYVMEIYRGAQQAPPLRNGGKLFIDGLKLFFAWTVYMLPVIAVLVFFGGLALFAAIEESTAIGGLDEIPLYPALFMPILTGFLLGVGIAVILGILISLIAIIGFIRMARTDRFSEAFNFRGILATIRSMGWGSYIFSIVILFIVMLIFCVILAIVMAIPYVGLIAFLFLIPPVTIFGARYLTLLYQKESSTGNYPEREDESAGPVLL
jgi:hypothetical protein